MTSQSSGRFKLLGIFAAFGFPLLLATLIYINADDYTFERTNKGSLIEPAQSIMTAALTDQRGQMLDQTFFTGKWHLVLWAGPTCDLRCEANLFKIRQARLILGRKAARVATAYLSDSAQSFNKISKDYPSIKLVRFTQPRQAVGQSAAQIFNSLPTGQIYLIDPLGNVLMSYPKDIGTQSIVKDVKRLLSASKIG